MNADTQKRSPLRLILILCISLIIVATFSIGATLAFDGGTQLTAITLATDDARRWCLGQRLLWQDSLPDPEKAVLRVREEGGNFLGIGQMIQSENEWLLAPKLVFAADFNPE